MSTEVKASWGGRSVSVFSTTAAFPSPCTVLLGTPLALWNSCMTLNERLCYRKCCHWTQIRGLQIGLRAIWRPSSLSQNRMTISQEKNFRPSRNRADSRPSSRSQGRRRRPTDASQPALRRRHVRRRAATSATADQSVLPGLSRARSYPPLPIHATPFLTWRSPWALYLFPLLNPRDFSNRVNSAVAAIFRQEILAGEGPGQQGSSALAGREGPRPQTSPAIGWTQGGVENEPALRRRGQGKGRGGKMGVTLVERWWQTALWVLGAPEGVLP